MKAKEILNLCEGTTVTVKEASQVTLDYFLKKFKAIGADVSRMEDFQTVTLEYLVSEDFELNLKKNTKRFISALARLLDINPSVISFLNYTAMFFYVPVPSSQYALFHILVRSGVYPGKLTVEVRRFDNYFWKLRKDFLDVTEINEIYKIIDLLVKAFRLITPE